MPILQELQEKQDQIKVLESEVPLLEKKVEAMENELEQKMDDFSPFRRLTQSGEFQLFKNKKTI